MVAEDNYALTYNSHGSLLALGIVMIVLIIIAVTLRIISERRYYQKLGISDIFMIPAFVFSLGLSISVVVATANRWLGSHSDPSNKRLFAQINQFEYGFWIAYTLAVGFIKLSILFFFRVLFRVPTGRYWFDWCNWTLIGVTTAWLITFTFTSIFLCGADPAALWETSFWVEQKCVNTYAVYSSASVINFVIDLGILIEPMVLVCMLKLQPRKKVQACLIFLISGFAVVAGMMRMIYWLQALVGKRSRLVYNEVGLKYPITDLEPLVSIGIFWTMLEVGVGFIVSCLLPSAKLLDTLFKSPVYTKIKSITSSLISLRSHSRSRGMSTSEDHNKKEMGGAEVAERHRKEETDSDSQDSY